VDLANVKEVRMSLRDHLKNEQKKLWEEMSGSDIAKELGISRQAVSNTLKRAMKKAFVEAKKIEDWDAFETAVAMSVMFGQGETDLKKFFRLFPPDIRKEIEADAVKRFGGKFK
jgi:DNA-binding transcriptional regulator LsrR (DeoR family)